MNVNIKWSLLQKFISFGALYCQCAILLFEALTYHDESASTALVRLYCMQTVDSFALKTYCQTEMVIAKMIQVNRPINSQE